MRVTGLEPAHRKTLDPKSSASANSATPAYNLRKYFFALDYNIKKPLICQALLYQLLLTFFTF